MPDDEQPDEGYWPIPPEMHRLYIEQMERARGLYDHPNPHVQWVAGDAARLADECLTHLGTIKYLMGMVERARERLAELAQIEADRGEALGRLFDVQSFVFHACSKGWISKHERDVLLGLEEDDEAFRRLTYWSGEPPES